MFWYVRDVGSELMCVWAAGAFVGVCVGLRDFVRRADAAVCVSLSTGVGVDCMSECEYVFPVKGQTRKILP